MTEIEQVAADVTYLEVRRWVFKLVWQAHKRWPWLDKEDCMREAYLGYCLAYKTYKPENGAFTTWVGVQIKGKLLDLVKKNIEQAKKASKFIKDFDFDVHPSPDKPTFNTEEWLAGLSEDAQLVAKLVVYQPPIDIRLLIKQIGEKKKLAYRHAIREFLKESKWTAKRIKKVFNEIKESL